MYLTLKFYSVCKILNRHVSNCLFQLYRTISNQSTSSSIPYHTIPCHILLCYSIPTVPYQTMPIIIHYHTMLYHISIIILVYCCKCFDFNGYCTRYLFLGRQRVAKQSSFQRFHLKKCIKINFFVVEYFMLDLLFYQNHIRLFFPDFFETIDSGFFLVNYHLIEISNW